MRSISTSEAERFFDQLGPRPIGARSEDLSTPTPTPTPTDRPRPLESLCHGSSHKLFDYSFINIHLIHLWRPRGKRTNERGAEDLLFVPLTLASPFACRSSVTSRDPSKGRSYSHANSRGRKSCLVHANGARFSSLIALTRRTCRHCPRRDFALKAKSRGG